MCGGIEYQDQKIYFPQPGARLPVRLRDGHVSWITWGRRKDESIGKLPNGGWARLNSIKSDKWKPWHTISWRRMCCYFPTSYIVSCAARITLLLRVEWARNYSCL